MDISKIYLVATTTKSTSTDVTTAEIFIPGDLMRFMGSLIWLVIAVVGLFYIINRKQCN